MSIRVLLVDDHALVREAIRSLLQSHPDIEVVGEAGDGTEGIEKNRELAPDVVLMDISMPSVRGIEATRRILADRPGVRVVGLSRFGNLAYTRAMLEAGALGYVTKNSTSTELISAIHSAYAGHVFLQSSMVAELAKDYVQMIRFDHKSDPYERLTEREKEILKLIAGGHSCREIAEGLYLSTKTILNHRRSIMEKLGVRTPTQLLKYAIKAGLSDEDSL